MDAHSPPDTLLRIADVLRRTAQSRSVMYREIAAGRFPAPVKIGPKAAAWSARDVDDWIRERVEQARRRRHESLARQAATKATCT